MFQLDDDLSACYVGPFDSVEAHGKDSLRRRQSLLLLIIGIDLTKEIWKDASSAGTAPVRGSVGSGESFPRHVDVLEDLVEWRCRAIPVFIHLLMNAVDDRLRRW